MVGYGLCLELAEYAVHHPVDGSGAHARAFANANALQMLYDGADDGQLYVRRIGHDDAASAFARYKLYGAVVVDGEGEHSFLADDLYAVFLGALMAHETP